MNVKDVAHPAKIPPLVVNRRRPYFQEMTGRPITCAVPLLAILMASFLLESAVGRAQTSGADHPIPDITLLLKDVEKNQKKIDQTREKYACTEVEEQDHLSKQGKLKKRTFKEYEIFFIGGREIQRLVKKNGKRLRAAQQRKEDARVRKQVEKYEKQLARRKSGDDPDGIGISVFLRTSQFDHARWTRYRNQEVIAFDFAPNSAYKPRTFAEKVAHSLAGEVWVDPQAHTIVRLEAWFDHPVKIGGGLLASLDKGTTVAIEQALVNHEVWLPSYLEFHGSARLLLFKGIRMNVIDRYSDYRVFHVKSFEKVASRPVGASSK